jgi:hypothetical protein
VDKKVTEIIKATFANVNTNPGENQKGLLTLKIIPSTLGLNGRTTRLDPEKIEECALLCSYSSQ